MNEIRKLMEAIEKLDEGYNSRLATAIDELVANNKSLSPVELVGRARLELGDEAAKYLSDKLESDGDFQDVNEAIPKSTMYKLVRKSDNVIVDQGSKARMHKLRKAGDGEFYVGVSGKKNVGDKFKESVEEAFRHKEDPIPQQIRSLLAQNKRVMSKLAGASGEVVDVDDLGFIKVLDHGGRPFEVRVVDDPRLELVGNIDHYALRVNPAAAPKSDIMKQMADELGLPHKDHKMAKMESMRDIINRINEGWPQEETYQEMVEYWKQSLSSAIVRKGVFKELYAAAGENIDELNAAIADEAESIADSYHGSGEGIGTSDVNHFIASIGRSLGVDDVFGWNKPKIKSDDEMERDKTNRYAKYNTAIRGKEGLGEDEDDIQPLVSDKLYAKIVADLEKVKPGYEPGAMGLPSDKPNQVSVMAWNRETGHEEDMVFNLDTMSFEGSGDDFMLSNPFEARMLELAGVPVKEAQGKKVTVPVELSDPDPKNPKATSADAEAFLHALGPDDEVDDYVVDPETGEVLFEPFMTKRGEGMDKFKSAREYHDQKETWVPSMYGADNQDDAWEELGDLRHGNNNAARFYNIVWRNLGDLLGDPRDLGTDAEDWGELDYDTGYDVPVAIKRKDGKKMQEEDYDNFRTLASLVKHATGNISLSMMGTTEKGTVARFTPTLM